MVTKVTTDQVYELFKEMAPCSSTDLAVKLRVSSSTVKAHLGKLRDADLCYMVKRDFDSGQIYWCLGKGTGKFIRKIRRDDGGSHNAGQRRRKGTMADVPKKQFWWSTTV